MLFLAQHFFQQLVSDGARQMGQEFPFLESLSRHLLVGSNYGGDEMVCNRHLFMLDEEDTLVGLRPHAIQALDLVLPPHYGLDASLVEVVDRVHAHHIWRENLLVPPGDLQVTVTAIRLEEKPMPGAFRRFKQFVNRHIQFRNVELWHFCVHLLSGLAGLDT
jgi:hypothetical protein